VGLTWGKALGATSYNAKRSNVSGGPYANLAAGIGVTNMSFTDSTVADGTTYYYAISTVNSAGEGAISAEAGATPPSANTVSVLSLSFQSPSAGLTLGWQNGTLQSATNIGGPWEDVVGAAPPAYIVTPDDPQRFFRVKR
jgi:cellulose 1,4-beta-cellobiosidase